MEYKFKKIIGERILVDPMAGKMEGTVVGIGKGLNGNKLSVDVGDTVIFGQYSGTEIIIDGKSLLIMRESDIFIVI